MRKPNFFPLAIFLVYCLMACLAMAKSNITTDQSSLLTLKAHLHIDHSHILWRNWSDSAPVCAWIGVTCGVSHQRVTAIDISQMNLTGSLPPQLGNLSFLVSINLSRNNFYGNLPQDLIHLRRLKIIDFSFNRFIGQIPSWFGFFSELQFLYIRSNNFTGFIPPSLFNISSLQSLDISFNPLHGEIPKEVGNLYNLKVLRLDFNGLRGAIPLSVFNISTMETLGFTGNTLTGDFPLDKSGHGLPRLKGLFLSKNELSGKIPSNLSVSSQLQVLSLSLNNFSGPLPQEFGNLTMLSTVYLGGNKLTGTIPQEIGNLYNLKEIELSSNNFIGSVPPGIFNISTMISIKIADNQLSGNLDESISLYELPNLEELKLNGNSLHGRIPNSIANSSKLILIDLSSNNFTSESPELSFITSFTNCRYLTKLGFNDNPLSGSLPASIGNLSTSLQYLYGYHCDLRGSIPSEIGNLKSLILLSVWGNQLTGSVPASMVNLQKIQGLALSLNKMSGPLPDSICELQNVFALDLSHNRITGEIPGCIGNITTLRFLYIDTNELTSSIPTSLWLLDDILELNLSSNFLSGSLPNEIRNLKVVEYIDLSYNQFSGSIPTTIGEPQTLTNLSLAHNKLQGSIPESIGKLLNLERLDLSYNNLSGNIPKSLEVLRHITYLNVSFNDLRGEVPSRGPFKNFSNESFMSNKGLCSDLISGVPRCHNTRVGRQNRRKLMALFALLGPIIAMALVYVVVRWRRKKFVEVIEGSSPSRTSRISYYELMRATEGYSKNNLLGIGSFGSVYRGTLNNGEVVAVKVFNLQLQNALKSFDVECEVLSKIRHRNLCKVISSCSNQDFKALVLKYMSNGNLDKWLYSDDYFLDILQRINIMIDVACALEYLHYGYSTPIVHCDLKPSNVLLDEDKVAHLSDFGIAKLLGDEKSKAYTTTLGTLGYIAPEYGLEGSVSVRCDVYSYGIMLMEVFTRMKPNNEKFSGDLNLRSWINDSIPHEVTQVIDSNLLIHEESDYKRKLKCLSSIMELALNCSIESANERLNMKDVVVSLKNIKSHLHA